MVVKFTLGQVNLTGYLRVSLEKVADPGVEVTVQYIALPFTTYVYVSPEIDSDDYNVFFREAPDLVSLGTLRSQAFFNAQSREFDTERRFYKMGSLGAGMSWTVDSLHDDYLKNKVVTGVEKEGMRYLEPGQEYDYIEADGNINLLTSTLSSEEVLVVELKFNVGASNASPVTSNIFSDTVVVTSTNYTVSSPDKKKRLSLESSGTTQKITLPGLSGLAVGDFFYIENKRAGLQVQTSILPNGTDKFLFNGFGVAPYQLSELWLSRGQSLYLRKDVVSSTSYWEIIFGWNGVNVGARMASTYKDLAGWLPEDGRLLDGDTYPGLYWWVRNMLPSDHKVTDDTVANPGYAHPSDKVGQFVIHSTNKNFRLPNTQGISEKGLKNFSTYGTDTTRAYDRPGGYQAGKNKKFWSGTIGTLNVLKVDGTNTEIGTDAIGPTSPNIRFGVAIDQSVFGDEVAVNNSGVIFMRYIG